MASTKQSPRKSVLKEDVTMHPDLAKNTVRFVSLGTIGEGGPLGVSQIQYEAPDGQAERGKPLEECKTYRWIRGVRECAELAGCGQCR